LIEPHTARAEFLDLISKTKTFQWRADHLDKKRIDLLARRKGNSRYSSRVDESLENGDPKSWLL